MATEPISAGEIYRAVFGKDFVNETMPQPFDYTFFKTRYIEFFGGKEGYIFERDRIIAEVTEFVKEKTKH